MIALTIPAPRAVAVAHHGCRVINRDRAPSGWSPGSVVAIHAAHRERAIYTEVERVSFLARVDFKAIKRAAYAARGRVVALARIVAVVTDQRKINCDRRWWLGPVGIVLADVEPVEGMVSVAAPRGNVGSWALPDEVVADLGRALVERLRPRRDPMLVVP